jgi:ribosomal protein L4
LDLDEKEISKKLWIKKQEDCIDGYDYSKAKDKAVLWLEDFDLAKPKTKDIHWCSEKYWLDGNKILFVLGSKNENIAKSLRNIANVKYITIGYLNPLDVMSAKKVVFFETALNAINSK